MASTRIKDLATTATQAASDDYLAIDGATNGTRKIKPEDLGGGGSSVSPYTSNPAALGSASPGSSDNYSRGDHVHPKPSASDVGAIAAPGSPSSGQYLVWNGSAWVAATPPGMSMAAKQALLDCFANVAWTTDDGQDYYDALEEALDFTAGVSSISAVYTQSGTVYATDSLDSLRADLIVTATYEDSSTAVVAGYTLSGTLTVGTSTITVTYSGKTTTFTVTVSAEPAPQYDYIYNWDFTQSLTDSVGGVTAVLSTNQVRDSEGVHFANMNDCIQLTPGNTVDMKDKTVIIKVAASASSPPTTQHGRIFAIGAQSGQSNTAASAFTWRYNNTPGWTLYTGTSWNSTSLDTTTYPINFFTNKKIKLYIDSSRNVTLSYAAADSEEYTTITTFSSAIGSGRETGYLMVGNASGNANDLIGFVIAGVSIIDGEV